jgi:predicted RNase H-like nuclease
VTAERVLGVDACKSGWIGIALAGETTTAYTATHIDELVAAAHADEPIQTVAIDMPIGLPDAGYRRADQLARLRVGPQWRSVFMTPVRPALVAPDHASATAVNQEATGAGVSAQAFALRHKLLEVDAWVRYTDMRVVEVHPEVTFATLAGRPLPESKRTWAGAIRRRRLLVEAGIVLDDDLGPAGSAAAVDDVLDAAVAAWTARRVARDEAQPMPNPPDIFTDGIPSAIWT